MLFLGLKRNVTFLVCISVLGIQHLSAQRIKDYISADTAIFRGIVLHDKEQYQKAIESYKLVSSNDPSYPLALYEIALSFYESKNYDSAYAYATECITYPESNFYESAVILRGNSLKELERFPEALQNYDAALSKFPKNVSLLHNKAMVYKKSKEFQKALDLFKEVNVEYSGYIKNQLAIAQLAEEEGFLTQAFLAYSHALLYSIGTKHHLSILAEMNKLAAKKLEENPKDIIFSAEGDQFGDIENLLKTQAALQKKYKINTEIDLPIVRQLHLLFAQLENYEPGNGYFDKYYVPFYKDIAKDGKFNQFIDILFLPINDPQIQRLIGGRSKEVIKFAEELGIKLANTVNRRDLTIMDKKLNLACHFNKGIKSCGNYNEDNKKDGVWYVFHTNGNLNRYGELVNDKATNLWEYYYTDGKKSAEYMYKDDNMNGAYKRFYRNGKISEEGSYLEDSLDGEFKSYYMNGNLKSKGNYINNKYDSEWRTYYVNGNPKGIFNYKEDLFDGEYTTFAVDGKTVLSKLNYKNGKLDGKQETYHLNGNKENEGEFNLGKRIGEHKEYFTNGVLKEETKYEDDELIDQKDYYVSGALYTKYGYKKGELESMDMYDYDGNHTTTYKFKNDYLKQMITYNKNGEELEKESIGKNDEFAGNWFYTNNRSMQGNYKKGKRHGRWVFYNINGTKDSESNYELGVKNGLQREYNYLGILSSEFRMEDNKNHGYYRTYYPSGELKSESWYIEGKLNGPRYEYYIDGTTMNESYYVDGDLEGKYIEYDPDGKTLAHYNYKNDEFISYTNFDRDGKELNSVVISENKTEMKPCSKLSFTSYKRDKIYGLNEGETYSEPAPGIFDFKGNYLAGELHGVFTHYYSNGNKNVSANYLLDNKDGSDTFFYHNGNIFSIENNILGVNYGKYNRFYYTGQLWLERNYINDNRDGFENVYGINGELVLQKIYKLGYFYGIVRNNANGELTDTLKARNETLDYEANYKNGKTAVKESIKLDNLLSSEFFDENGQLLYIYQGEENGNDLKKEYYYTNGKLMNATKFDKGQQTEKLFYRTDGSLEMKEELKFDQVHGRTIVKDEQGATKLNLIYRNNIAYELGE